MVNSFQKAIQRFVQTGNKEIRQKFWKKKDLAAVHDVMRDMKKLLIEMLYDEELKEHLGFPKSSVRPEDSDNYRNGSCEKKNK